MGRPKAPTAPHYGSNDRLRSFVPISFVMSARDSVLWPFWPRTRRATAPEAASLSPRTAT